MEDKPRQSNIPLSRVPEGENRAGDAEVFDHRMAEISIMNHSIMKSIMNFKQYK